MLLFKEMVKSSNNDYNMPTCSIQSLCKMSSSSNSDSQIEIKQRGRKRYLFEKKTFILNIFFL